MGNEPPYNEVPGHFNSTGTRIAQDFIILRKVLDSFPELRSSIVVGPDVETPRDGSYSGEQAKIVSDFVKLAKDVITAVTVHHYYFVGPGKKVEDFYDLKYFKYLESTLPLLRETIYKAAGKEIPIWIGETSDASSEGTPNITNTYASGFFWLDKLGLAAKNGIKLVARQDFYGANYPLINTDLYPNPDYWLSYVFKKLVGRDSLNSTVAAQTGSEYVRVYAHCTSKTHKLYKAGTVVLYAINLHPNTSITLSFDHSVFHGKSHIYLLQPGNNNLQSTEVYLNRKVMKMIDDITLPELNPDYSVVTSGFKLPPLTFGFIVFLDSHIHICSKTLI